MAKTIPLSIVCSISVFLSGCLHRAESGQMLEKRADYEGAERDEMASLKLEGGLMGNVPTRSTPRVAHIWIFPHETPTKEYFWGGWISVVVEGDKWELEKSERILPEKPDNAKRSPE